MIKITKDEVESTFREYGYKIVDITQYKNSNSFVHLEDELGYNCLGKLGKIKIGERPNIFGKSNPYTVDNIRLFIKNNNLNIEWMSNEYTNNRKPETCKCLVCGNIWNICWSNLKQGKGCPVCSTNKNAEKRKSNTEEFIKKAKIVHGDKYEYFRVDYILAREKVFITCKEHGDFLQTPNDHLNGYGCPKCIKNIKLYTDTFIEKAKVVHDDLYDYSRVNYITHRHKVKIVCKIHGEFEQDAGSHLAGHGCPKCNVTDGVYNITLAERNKEIWLKRQAIVYFVKLFNECESFFKIGITTNITSSRMKGIPYDYEIIKEINTNLYEATYMEKEFHDKYKEYKYIPIIYFGGHTECFNEIG